MPKNINIRRTFKAIRKMPLEVSFEQVEYWVQLSASPPLTFYEKMKAFFKKYY